MRTCSWGPRLRACVVVASLVSQAVVGGCGNDSEFDVDRAWKPEECPVPTKDDQDPEAVEPDVEVTEDELDREADAALASLEESGGASADESEVVPLGEDENPEDQEAAEPDVPQGDTVLPAPFCRKTLRVIFATGVNTDYFQSNGCWKIENGDDKMHRRCGFDPAKPIGNPHGDTWVYDDTNPEHDPSGRKDKDGVRRCAEHGSRGYEYMAKRSGRWLFVSDPKLTAYFAELYMTGGAKDVHLLKHYWYRNFHRDRQIAAHRRYTYPMVPFGSTTSARTLGSTVLMICKKIRTHGYLGVYRQDWIKPLHKNDRRVKMLSMALNKCTGR